MNRLRSLAGAVRRGYERSAAWFESGVQLLERRYTPLGRFSPGPFEGWRFLWQPALEGFLGMVLVLAGCSFTNSPFKLDMTSTWFFGEPVGGFNGTPSETKYLLSIVLVYGGLLLLMRVWLRLAEVMQLHAGAPMSSLWWMLALWAIPMIVAPPLFSRDVFSYAAQGEMTAHHISPYFYGPFTLGAGSNAWVKPVDPLWGNAPAPYGPLFLFLDGSIDRLTGHHQLAAVVGLRLLEVVAVGLIGVGVSQLARGMGRDPGEAFVLSALNPLVLLTLIGGAHNDAIMAALLVTGIALAVKKRPVWALVACSCAAAIKAPAALGLGYVAWTWHPPGAAWRQRVRPALIGAAVAAAVLGVSTWLAGFGFGWVENLFSNGTVRSWAAPATGVGLAISYGLHAMGAGSVSTAGVLSVTRVLGPRRLRGAGAVAAPSRRAPRLGALAGGHPAAAGRARAGRPAVVPGVGAGAAGGQLPGPRALLAAGAVDHRPLHRHPRRRPAPLGAGPLQPAAHRGGRRAAGRGAADPDGEVDPVVLAGAPRRGGRRGLGVGRHHVLVLDDVEPTPCLRPTSISVPTRVKPHFSCRRIDPSFSPTMRAMSEW